MSDDSFIREVEQELRSDRLNALWKRFGPFIIGGVVLIVLATAGWRGWLAWNESRAGASGDRFLAAIEAAEEGREEEALAMLRELEEDGHGRYDVLARMRAAAIVAESDPRAAIEAFTAVAGDGATPPAIADAARLRAAYLLVDHGTAGEVNALVGPLAVEDEPMRHSAREALGLAAWKAGERERAADQFRAIAADREAPPALARRANEMLALIASLGDGGTIEVGEPTVAPAETMAETPVEGETGAATPEPLAPEGTATPLIVTPLAGEGDPRAGAMDGAAADGDVTSPVPATPETPPADDTPVEAPDEAPASNGG